MQHRPYTGEEVIKQSHGPRPPEALIVPVATFMLNSKCSKARELSTLDLQTVLSPEDNLENGELQVNTCCCQGI